MSTLRTVMDGLHERLSLLEAAFRERRQPCQPRGGETVGRLSRGSSSSSSDSESESESSSDSEGSSSDDSD